MNKSSSEHSLYLDGDNAKSFNSIGNLKFAPANNSENNLLSLIDLDEIFAGELKPLF